MLTEMTETTPDSPKVSAFINRWARSGVAELANHQLFISELCDLIGVFHLDSTTPNDSENAYFFETPEGNFSKFMHSVFPAYTVY
jgi:hypothetical protein